MSALDFLLPWDRQPHGVVRPDVDAPYASNLRAWLPANGSLYDATGAGVTVTGDPVCGLFAVPGLGSVRAINFDGVNDEISRPFPILSRFSMLAWVYVDHTLYHPDSDYYAYIRRGGVFENNSMGALFIRGSSSFRRVGFYGRSGSSLRGFEATTALSNEAWHRIAATFDGSTYRIYADGVLLGSTASGAGTDGGQPLAFGGLGDTVNSAYGTGPAFDLRVYDVALPAEFFANDYANPWNGYALQTIWVPVSAGGGPTNYPVTAAESVTALDSCSVLIGYASTATEAGSAADTASQVAALSAAAAESATAADTVNGTAAGDYAGTVTEAGSAADTSSNVAAFAGTVAETGTAADSSTNVAALGGTVSEAGTALDTVNGTATGDFAGTLTELASAADTASIVAALSGIAAEAASAADSLAAARAVSALIAEAMSAVDAVSGSAAGDYNVAVDELSAAVDSVSQAMAAYAAVAESAAALDTVSAGGQLAGVVAELATALDTIAVLTGNTALGSLAGSIRKRGLGRSAALPRINRSNIQR